MGEENIGYRDGATELTAFRACPDEPGVRPGVVVVHGGAGLDEHARSRARAVAALGYVALACDMYGNGVAGDRERVLSCLRGLLADRELLRRRFDAAVELLSSDAQVDGRVAAIGYCFGGRVVLEAARSGAQLAGVVSVHGNLATGAPAEPGEITAKVLACHGALDPHVPREQVDAFIDEMNAAGADWQLHIYGHALHGFTHEDGPPGPGVAYNAVADARSSLAISAFLAEAFGAEDDASPRRTNDRARAG